jgi:hypothetical protein
VAYQGVGRPWVYLCFQLLSITNIILQHCLPDLGIHLHAVVAEVLDAGADFVRRQPQNQLLLVQRVFQVQVLLQLFGRGFEEEVAVLAPRLPVNSMIRGTVFNK